MAFFPPCVSFLIPSRPYRYFIYTLLSILAFYSCYFSKPLIQLKEIKAVAWRGKGAFESFSTITIH